MSRVSLDVTSCKHAFCKAYTFVHCLGVLKEHSQHCPISDRSHRDARQTSSAIARYASRDSAACVLASRQRASSALRPFTAAKAGGGARCLQMEGVSMQTTAEHRPDHQALGALKQQHWVESGSLSGPECVQTHTCR
jgi:hypothetical protein